MAKLAANVYGDALFQLAVEEGKVDEFLEQVREVRTCILANAEFTQLMNHPGVTKENKIAMVKEVTEGKLSKEIVGFLVIVLEKGHYKSLDEMITYFEGQVKEYKNIGVVYITTPTEVNIEQKKQIEAKILSTTKYVELECHYRVDASLMGGMIIRMQDRVIDSSLKTKLENLSKELLKTRVS